MQIILREASNDLDAYRTAQGMENAGASVFSVTFAGESNCAWAVNPVPKFIVWAKYEDPITVNQIDEAIERELDATTGNLRKRE